MNHAHMEESTGTSQAFPGAEDLVLKLNGRFFGSDKVQNEVACLRLMEIHCPHIPAPRVRAWSEKGGSFMRVSSDGDDCTDGKIPDLEMGEHSEGWVLMTSCPGNSLSPDDWDEQTMKSLAYQLADIVASWRQSIPATKHCGNLLLCNDPGADLSLTSTTEAGNFPAAMVKGMIILRSETESCLADALHNLETGEVHAPNRHLLPLLRRFADETLPLLDLAPKRNKNDQEEFIFSHLDIYPRNILVSGSRPKITGIVDFEFSGFFPAAEEFVQDDMQHLRDWPHETYKSYLERLEELGVETPAKSIGPDVWKQTISIFKVIENASPWWLPGDQTGEELAASLKEAEGIVKKEIKALEEYVSSGSRV